MKTYIAVTATLLLVTTAIHLVRLARGWALTVGTTDIPAGASVLAVAVTAGLGIWGFALLRRPS